MTPLAQKEGTKLNIGCASIAPPGWINLDGSWNAWFAKHLFLRRILRLLRLVPPEQMSVHWPKEILIHDLRRGLPFSDESLGAVYGSHLLEHLYLDEAAMMLRECFRVLAAGGILRLVVPDLRSIAMDYLQSIPPAGQSYSEGGVSAGDHFCRRLDMRPPHAATGPFLYRLYSALKDFHTHKWMYDAESLRNHMKRAGFEKVTLKSFLESSIPGIEEVEKEERFGDHAGICLEGNKPFVCSPSK